jgi:hypothetical protein
MGTERYVIEAVVASLPETSRWPGIERRRHSDGQSLAGCLCVGHIVGGRIVPQLLGPKLLAVLCG